MKQSIFPSPAEYQGALPFPHGVVKGFLSDEFIKGINDEWPELDTLDEYMSETSVKLATHKVGGYAKKVVEFMTHPNFLAMLSEMTGIANLKADPGLNGAGLHCIERGGFLGRHVDFNVLRPTKKRPELVEPIYRRVNALLYLNEEWDEEWGGALKLYDSEMVERVIIPPTAGTLAIFTCSEDTWHGHPEPLTCPPDRQRRSLALYYYTTERPDSFEAPHSTIYR